eukprot:CAMPEP_0113572170 /NCGR_PEP_ID=MMETSP0015_2-20120614/25950_1 /TAXON_ID=2838 /ORGANISM="Odontella" /LENGTH=288 /DNA_ID=CAMNT_0000475181 /DNA_START=17 /DNA_END=883 /DNA_ORIENTATION=- /assembly_acc=CAM_ASM_000160
MARALILLSAIATAAAAPAIVWKNGAASPQHSSETIGASSLLKSTFEGQKRDASSLASVVFVVGRDRDGSESLSSMASLGKLPRTQSKYESAHSIHHHVGGVESSKSVARDIAAALGPHSSSSMDSVAHVSLSEFNSIMTSAKFPPVAVVHVNKAEAAALDEAVEGAVEHSKVHSVVLTAQRSVDEVKHERTLIKRRNKVARVQKKAYGPSRRRLEDQEEDEDENANNNQNQEDMEGVYYVNMTPNIFAGLLFTFMFIVVTNIGLNCMGAISFADVYVSKCPSVGREV